MVHDVMWCGLWWPLSNDECMHPWWIHHSKLEIHTATVRMKDWCTQPYPCKQRGYFLDSNLWPQSKHSTRGRKIISTVKFEIRSLIRNKCFILYQSKYSTKPPEQEGNNMYSYSTTTRFLSKTICAKLRICGHKMLESTPCRRGTRNHHRSSCKLSPQQQQSRDSAGLQESWQTIGCECLDPFECSSAHLLGES